MRILLRQEKTGLYLQNSGRWGESRETARNFESSALAYFWAIEQKLMDAVVLLAFSDPSYDFTAMRCK